MSITVATLKALLTMDVSDFTSGARQARVATSNLEEGVTRAGITTGALGGFIGDFALQAVNGIGRVAKAAVTMGLQSAAGAEQANIAFTKFFNNNNEAATAFQKKLMDFAAQTPFEFPELRESASRFMAVGVAADRIIPIMSALGDSISAVGGSSEQIGRATTALIQMQQKGKVTGEEMMQLTEAGIPAWDALASVMGVSVPEAMKKVEQGAVGAGVMLEAMETRAGAAMQRTTGMMQVQSQTLMGLWSTFKDTLGISLGEAFAPLVKGLEAVLPQVTSGLNDVLAVVGPALSTVMVTLLNAFSTLIPVIVPLIQILGGALAEVAVILAGGLMQVITELQPHLPELVEAFVQLAVAAAHLLVAIAPLLVVFLTMRVEVLTALAQALTAVLVAITPLTSAIANNTVAVHAILLAFTAWKAINMVSTVMALLPALAMGVVSFITYSIAAWEAAAAVIAATWPILLIVAAIALLVAGLIFAYTHWQFFRDFVDSSWQALQVLIGWVVTAAGVIGELAGKVAEAAQTGWGWIVTAAEAVGNFAGRLAEAAQTVAGWVSTGVSALIDFFTDLPNRVIQGRDAIYDFAVMAGTALMDLTTQLPGMVAGWVTSFLSWIPGVLAALPGQLAYIAGYIIGWLLGTAIMLIAGLAVWSYQFLQWAVGVANSIPGWLLSIAIAIWNWLFEVAATFAPQLVSWLVAFRDWAYQLAVSAGFWLMDTSNAIWNWVAATAAALPGNLVSWLMAFGAWGAQLAAGMATWVAGAAVALWNWITSTAAALPGNLAGWLSSFSNWAVTLAVSFPGWLASAGNAILGWIQGIPGMLSGAISSLTSIGRNIAEAIWNGIQGMAGWLMDKVRSFATGIVDGVKDAMHIGSPSKDMIYVGEMLSRGIAVGFESDAVRLQSSIAATMGNLSFGTDVGAGATSGLGGASTGGNVVVIQSGAVQVSVSGAGRDSVDLAEEIRRVLAPVLTQFANDVRTEVRGRRT